MIYYYILYSRNESIEKHYYIEWRPSNNIYWCYIVYIRMLIYTKTANITSWYCCSFMFSDDFAGLIVGLCELCLEKKVNYTLKSFPGNQLYWPTKRTFLIIYYNNILNGYSILYYYEKRLCLLWNSEKSCIHQWPAGRL